MNTSTKPKHPPVWWTKVIKDIERVVASARLSYDTPGLVIGTEESDTATVISVRLPDGAVGHYDLPKEHKAPLIGSKLKNIPLEFADDGKEPSLQTFIFEVIRQEVKLVPRIWLKRIITKMVEGRPITIREDLKAFPEWVLLSPKIKKDKTLIDILYRVTKYEGIKGLSRFNDKSDI